MIRVLIATNETILAKGLEAILSAGGLHIVAICSDVFELFESFHTAMPDVAIIDVPVLPSPDVIRDLRRLGPQCQFVLWPRATATRQLTETMRTGGCKVVPPGTSPVRFIEAMKVVAEFSEPQSQPAEMVRAACNALQRELIALVGYGLSNEEIAAIMGSNEATVNKLVKDLARTLGAEDRYELALYGLSTLKDEAVQEVQADADETPPAYTP